MKVKNKNLNLCSFATLLHINYGLDYSPSLEYNPGAAKDFLSEPHGAVINK